MSNLVPLQQQSLALPTLAEKIQYAERMADAGLIPQHYRKQPANILVAFEVAQALNLPNPYIAMINTYVVGGRPALMGSLVAALVRRAGHRLRVSGDGQSATAKILRSDDTFEFASTWSLDRAKRAGLNSEVWQKYPENMLKWRAVSEVARDACPEVLCGLHTTQELGADDADTSVYVTAEVVDEPAAPAQAAARQYRQISVGTPVPVAAKPESAPDEKPKRSRSKKEQPAEQAATDATDEDPAPRSQQDEQTQRIVKRIWKLAKDQWGDAAQDNLAQLGVTGLREATLAQAEAWLTAVEEALCEEVPW